MIEDVAAYLVLAPVVLTMVLALLLGVWMRRRRAAAVRLARSTGAGPNRLP